MNYNSISRGYNELHGEEQRKKLNIIKQFLKVKPDDKLLDVGCGTGLSSEFDCFVVDLDPSINLLKQSKKNKVLGASEFLPFKNNSFDVVISVTAIHNFDDKKKAIKEIIRVGKTKFCISILKKSRFCGEILALIKQSFNNPVVVEEELDLICFSG